MTEVTVKKDKLAIEVQGWDKLWSLKSRLEIPLAQVTDVRMAEKERWAGIGAPGTFIPGVITAGTFYKRGQKVFWNVHDPAKAIVIGLRDERYTRLSIQVVDPAARSRPFKQRLHRRRNLEFTRRSSRRRSVGGAAWSSIIILVQAPRRLRNFILQSNIL